MRPRYWLLTTLAAVLIFGGGIVALNIVVDMYGLFRPTQGRRLGVFGDERVAKYLLSMRYVPENFNAILIGASISDNWDVTAIDKLRVYNGSLNGGNIVEEKAVIEAALARPGISVVMILVHPALTYSHEFFTVDMTPDLARTALGSLSLWDAYKDMINVRLGRIPRLLDYAGTWTYLDPHSEMNIHMKRMWSAPDFTVDASAWRAYRDLVATLHSRGVQIVFIVPPTSEQLLMTKRVPMQRYLQRMRSELGTGDLWIDFLTPAHEDFCRNRANFSDGVHFTPDGARQVVAYINTTVNQWIADRRLTVAKR